MPIANPTIEAGAVILTTAAGLRAKRADGTLDNIFGWDAVSGDLYVTAPVGTDVAGAQRVILNVAEVVVGKVAGQATLRVRSQTSQAVMYLDNNVAGGHSSLVYQRGGAAKWGVGMGTGAGGFNYEWYNYVRVGMDGYIDSATGTLTWPRGVSIPGSALVVGAAPPAAVVGEVVRVQGAFRLTGVINFADTATNILQLSISFDATRAHVQSFATKPLHLNAIGNAVIIGVDIAGGQLLRVGGAINATAYYQNGFQFVNGNSSYTQFTSPSGNGEILIGGTGDTANYYTNSKHQFRGPTPTFEFFGEFSSYAGAGAGATGLVLIPNGIGTLRMFVGAAGTGPGGVGRAAYFA